MVAIFLALGAVSTLVFFLVLIVLLFLAEPLWLLPWFVGSALIAALSFGVAVAVLARRDKNGGA